jgi:Na+-driven multidrug efflux pump
MIFTLVSSLFPAAIAGLMSNKSDVINSAVPYLRIMGLSFVFFTLSQVLVASQRSVEKVHFGMNIALLTLGLNITLNYCLIFGKLGFPALGVAGAAIATLISRMVEFFIAAVYIFRFDTCIGLKFADLRKLDGFFGKSLLNYGAPTVGSDTVWAINSFAYTAIIGRFTPDVIASFNIAGMMNTLVYIWLSGFAAAMGIMTGKLVGAGTGLQEIKRYTYRVQRFLIGLAFFTGLFVFLTRGPLIFMYKVSPGAAATAFLLMNVLSLTIMGTAYQMPCLIGLVKGGGSTSFGFKNDCVFVFLIVIPASIIAMSLKAPAPVVFLCLKSDQFLKCLVAVVVINRFRWIKNLTRDHDEVFK